MKKWLAVLLSSFMLLGVTGCTVEEKAYFDEMEKMSKWEHTESVIKANLSFDLKQVPEYNKVDLEIKGNSYSILQDGKEPKGMMSFSVKEKNNLFNISEVKGYVDGNKVYFSKNYIEDVMKSTGQEIPEAVRAVKQEYLLMDTEAGIYGDLNNDIAHNNKFFKEYMKNFTDSTKRNEMFNKMEKIGSLLEFQTALKKEGRTYTLEMDSDMILDQAEKVIENAVKNMEQILKILDMNEAIPSDPTTLRSMREEYETSGRKMVKEAIPMLKKSLKGSKYTQKETFSDDSLHSEAMLNVQFEGFGNGKLSLVSDSKKISPKKFEFPSKDNVISFDKYMELYIPPVKDTLTIDTTKKTLSSKMTGKSVPIKLHRGEDGETLYQFAPIMSMAGIEYGYDKAQDSIYVVQKGERVNQELYEKNGVSYVEEYQLYRYGISTDSQGNKIVLTVR